MWRRVRGDARKGPLARASLCDARGARGLRAVRALSEGAQPRALLFCPPPPSAASSRCARARRSPLWRQGAARGALRARDGPRRIWRPRDPGLAEDQPASRAEPKARAPSSRVSRVAALFLSSFFRLSLFVTPCAPRPTPAAGGGAGCAPCEGRPAAHLAPTRSRPCGGAARVAGGAQSPSALLSRLACRCAFSLLVLPSVAPRHSARAAHHAGGGGRRGARSVRGTAHGAYGARAIPAVRGACAAGGVQSAERPPLVCSFLFFSIVPATSRTARYGDSYSPPRTDAPRVRAHEPLCEPAGFAAHARYFLRGACPSVRCATTPVGRAIAQCQ